MITLQISLNHAKYLAKRGGHSHRGRGPFSRTVVLARLLDTLKAYQEFTDPRQTRTISKEFFDLIVRLIPQPWARTPYEVKTLEGFLAATPEFVDAVAAAGVDPAAVLAAVKKATPAEKLTLVDHAIQAQAPQAAAASPEGP